jgi:hypothetical protein
LPMPDTRPQLTHGHKSARLASGSNNEGPSAFVLKGHSRTLAQVTALAPGGYGPRVSGLSPETA